MYQLNTGWTGHLRLSKVSVNDSPLVKLSGEVDEGLPRKCDMLTPDRRSDDHEIAPPRLKLDAYRKAGRKLIQI